MASLVSRPIRLEPMLAIIQDASRGGIASFVGLVRNHHQGRQVARLEYSAYEPMAEAEIDRIVSEASQRWRASIVVEHRIGTLEIGDVAVAVVVATAHRAEAFDACRSVIEELKRRVPIWKKEHYADGTVAWVDPTAPATF